VGAAVRFVSGFARLFATVGRLRLLGLLRRVTGCLDDLRRAVFKVGGLIDCFRSKPREFLGVSVVAVLARYQRHGQEPRGAVAQECGVVIPVGHEHNNDRFAGFVA
jgi:hypothetical protein